MHNMQHAQKARPTLRMADGGMFGQIKYLLGANNPPQTSAPAAASRPAPTMNNQPPMVVAPRSSSLTVDDMGRALGFDNVARNKRQMEAAGLRNGGDLRTGAGGHVPGSGDGDKIPAKYEPGEFVVSNDMLDAAPQLRDQLHSLRNNVLAHKGMTPEQADAKALGGHGLRAAAGFDPQALGPVQENRFVTAGSGYKMPTVDPATGGYTGSPSGVPNGQTAGTQNFTPNATQAGGLRQGNQPPVMGGGNAGGASSVTPLQQPGGNNGVPRTESLKRTLLRDTFGSKEAWGRSASGVTDAVKDNWAKSGYQPAPVVEGPAKPQGRFAKLGGLAVRGAGAYGAATSGYGAVQDAASGNYGDAAIGAIDTAANLAVATASPAAVPAGIYLGAKGIASAVNNSLTDNAKDTIGSAVNTGVRSLGKAFGQDWGVDDSAYLAQKAETSLRNPQVSAPRAAAPATQASSNDPYAAANAAKLAAPQPKPEPTLRADPFAGQIKRVGNSYSGTNVGADAGMVDGQGNAVTPRGFVGIAPGQTQAQQNSTPAGDTMANDNLIRAANLRDGFDVNRGTSGDTSSRVFTPQGSGGYGILDKDYQRARSLKMDADSSTGSSKAKAAAANALLDMNKEISDAPRMAAERNNQLRIHQMQNDTTLRGQQMQNAATLRGQDISREGHYLTNDIAKANARYQVGKDKREFDISRSDYANTRDDKNFEKRQQATKDLHTEIGTMLPPGADGKPDMERAAQYATGMNALLGDRQRELQTAIKNDPNNPRAKEWQANLEHLATNGPAALDGATKQKYLAGMLAKDTATANHGVVTPWSGKAVNTNSPVVSLRSKPGIIFDDYSAKHSDGSESVIPARAVDGGWFSPADKRLQSLK